MTIDQLIKDLQHLSANGYGHARVVIEEEGLGYFGDLIDVNTLMTEGRNATLTLLGRASTA